MYPLGLIFHGSGLNITVMSLNGATPGAERMLTDLAAGDTPGVELPVAVLAVAARARRIASEFRLIPTAGNPIPTRSPGRASPPLTAIG
jgi:hypothetical protein